ncbi:MAG: alpha/beta fold hydrolase [Acidimicrobiales bacterium]
MLLHAGVADRQSWQRVAETMAASATVVTYDRRGFAQTPPSSDEFSHVDDLLGVVDAVVGHEESVWLAGTSAGGGVALDSAIVAPERVAGTLLVSPAVSGAPEPELDPGTARFGRLLKEALESGDLDEVNRLETWLWLDGPSQTEGRVGGEVRSLVLNMIAIALHNGFPEDAAASGIAAWDRLDELRMPVLVACGELDAPFVGSHSVLEKVAHLGELEAPGVVTGLLGGMLAQGRDRPPPS